jgi:glycosyltransferase involved in cell wall biosynthesis
MTRVSAVVPARDERPTLEGVLRPLLAHPMVDEVIVADDASVDGTAELARELGARVVSLPDNGGKAAAMALGVAAARNDVILFCDADLIGLSEEAITRIVEPVLRGDCAMFVGIRGRRSYWANRLLHFTPILGGERALRRSLWEEVPASYKRNFQIEIALNFFAKANGHCMDFTVIHGLRQVIKERKRGLLRGMVQRLSMVADIVIVSWRLYVVLQPQLMLRALPGRSYRSS